MWVSVLVLVSSNVWNEYSYFGKPRKFTVFLWKKRWLVNSFMPETFNYRISCVYISSKFFLSMHSASFRKRLKLPNHWFYSRFYFDKRMNRGKVRKLNEETSWSSMKTRKIAFLPKYDNLSYNLKELGLILIYTKT